MSTAIKQKQRSNWVTYFIVNGDRMIGCVYESDKYGRSLVFNTENINLNERIEIFDKLGKTLEDVDLIEYFQSMIPRD
ncbi:MAG TPA: hypothetical protein DDY71_05600 [Spirochaetia bacterium]|nr:hypothetical protein [Spirochaetia bacterium]